MRFAEFFAGIGLVRMAAERVGFECAFANDIDPRKREMYAANFDATDFVLGDIALLQPEQIPRVDLATASFPCTDLSLAGGRAGLAGQQSGTVWTFLKLLEGMGTRRPGHVLLENVPGLLTSNRGRDFQALEGALAELGYSVDTWLVDAAHFVPQSRKRAFVIARLAPALPLVMPTLPEREQKLEDLLEDLPENDPAWWSDARTRHLLSQIPVSHQSRLEGTVTAFRRVRNGKTVAELRDDGLAGCLRTPRGGSGRQILIQNGRPRLLTPRECARLMGAPDYVIHVGATQAYFGFGDAVVVPAVEWVLRHAF